MHDDNLIRNTVKYKLFSTTKFHKTQHVYPQMWDFALWLNTFTWFYNSFRVSGISSGFWDNTIFKFDLSWPLSRYTDETQ